MMEKRLPLNKWCWEKWLSACRKLKLDPCLSPCTITISKWIKDLHIRPETLKLVQERAGSTLEAIGIGKDFLSRTTVPWDEANLVMVYDLSDMLLNAVYHYFIEDFCTYVH
jgi:hypothetical protein